LFYETGFGKEKLFATAAPPRQITQIPSCSFAISASLGLSILEFNKAILLGGRCDLQAYRLPERR